jgi:predicted nucleic acid-binding protein
MPRRAARVRERRAPVSVLVDTNVVLDLVLAREPWAAEAAALLDAVASGRLTGFIAGHTITTIFYLVRRAAGLPRARTAVADILTILTVVPLEGADYLHALSLGLRDYEDAVQAVAALRAGATWLVTRNPGDYKGVPVEIRSAGEVLALLEEDGA